MTVALSILGLATIALALLGLACLALIFWLVRRSPSGPSVPARLNVAVKIRIRSN
jgi:hypothetical protein